MRSLILLLLTWVTLAPSAIGSHRLEIVTPDVLVLSRVVQTRDAWDFSRGVPAPGAFTVTAKGRSIAVAKVGWWRRVVYAPLHHKDLRIGVHLALHLVQDVPAGSQVQVVFQGEHYSALLDPYRVGSALHVNQVGWGPDWPKQAFVGRWLGTLGELTIAPGTPFSLLDPARHVVFTGKLAARPDPAQHHIMQADFSAFSTPGEYRLAVPGLGTSLPFRIDEGTAACFARTYALGVYHQRCGAPNALPFTRFTHRACHLAPASVPGPAIDDQLQRMAGSEREAGEGPPIQKVSDSYFPFVRKGTVDVHGGHHDAGDYSKYTINSAQMVAALVFACDAFPGVVGLDNLGLPESGDGKSDLLQIAHWETRFLSAMQDEDGGFSFLVHPRNRPYENDVLPDHGDPQMLFPKNTSATAAASAALAECASSPAFRKLYPEDAARYLKQAEKGWAFLERAWQKYGVDGAYQRISQYGDVFHDKDEIVWDAVELYLATHDPKYHDFVLKHLDVAQTRRWTWWRLFESYGCAIRSYAFAARTGRVPVRALDPRLLQACEHEIEATADDDAAWAEGSAFGLSYPFPSKRGGNAGWFFPLDYGFDLVTAMQLSPRPAYMKALVGDISYEAGGNPNDVSFICGLGWNRVHEIVNQYAQNDGRVLPPSG
ncbi:MAG: glycoside hydrolase family 9 protein, partial [Candidatus Xenobia bacterium]